MFFAFFMNAHFLTNHNNTHESKNRTTEYIYAEGIRCDHRKFLWIK